MFLMLTPPCYRLLVLQVVAILVTSSVSAQVVHYPPTSSNLNNLTFVLNGSGAPGIFNSSVTPEKEYGIYNWCNMPHVRTQEYKCVTSSSSPFQGNKLLNFLLSEPRPRTIPFNMWRSSNVTINAHHTRRTRFSRKISRGLVSVRVLCMQWLGEKTLYSVLSLSKNWLFWSTTLGSDVSPVQVGLIFLL